MAAKENYSSYVTYAIEAQRRYLKINFGNRNYVDFAAENRDVLEVPSDSQNLKIKTRLRVQFFSVMLLGRRI